MLYFNRFIFVLIAVLIFASPAFAASKSRCPDKVLDKGTIEGVYQGMECEDFCYVLMTLDNGETFYLLANEDYVLEAFGEATGQRVSITYNVEQFWNEFGNECTRQEVMTEGKVLAAVPAAPKAQASKAGAAKKIDDEAFIELCKTGTPQEVEVAIKAGADVNAKGKDKDGVTGVTALMNAAQYNSNPEVISSLIKAGADVNAKNQTGGTALIRAALGNKNPEVTASLVKAGADVNAKNNYGWTAFINAAEENNTEVITVLINAGADVNAKNNDGFTSLMNAARYNSNPEVITVLLKAGADVKLKDKNEKMAINYARDNKALINTAAFKELETLSSSGAANQRGKAKDGGYKDFKFGMSFGDVSAVAFNDGKGLQNATNNIKNNVFAPIFNIHTHNEAFPYNDLVGNIEVWFLPQQRPEKELFLFFRNNKLIMITAELIPEEVEPTFKNIKDKYKGSEISYAKGMVKSVIIGRDGNKNVYTLAKTLPTLAIIDPEIYDEVVSIQNKKKQEIDAKRKSAIP